MSAKTKAEPQSAIDHTLIRALGHPLRQHILRALNERVASPSELAKDLDEPLGNVSYHVKILAECDAIELVRTAPVRGAVEHFYRATLTPRIEDENWALLPASTRRALFDQTLQDTWDHLVAAGLDGGFDDPETHLSWTTFELDELGHAEMSGLLRDTVDRALEIYADALARMAHLPPEERESRRTELAIQHFHRASDGAGAPVRAKASPRRASTR